MTCARLLEEALADVYGEEKDEDEAGLLPPPQWRGKQHRTLGKEIVAGQNSTGRQARHRGPYRLHLPSSGPCISG